MLIAGLVLAGIAALIHVYIFVLESVLWTTDRARAVFGTTPEEAVTTKSLALNQGFYNLFLAIAVALGIVVLAAGSSAAGSSAVGLTLVLVGTGSMLAASLVLIVTSPSKASAALKQGVPPLLAVALIVLSLVV